MRENWCVSIAKVVGVTVGAVWGVSTGYADSPERRGLEIAREGARRDSGFGGFTAELTMILESPDGKRAVRTLLRRTLEGVGDGDKNVNVFEAPPDVKGTAVLTHTHPVDPDDQWIFLPSLGRVKRISTVNKSGPFMGSEFSFEDLTAPEVEKYQYRYLREEVMEGRRCFVMELIPVYAHSGYSKLVQYLDMERYQPVRTVHYDRSNRLMKTLTFRDYAQYRGRYWRPGEMVMENPNTGKRTRLVWKEYDFDAELTERDFSIMALRSGY